MSNAYEAATLTSAAPALNTAFAELRAGARRLFILEIGVFLGAATATNCALSRTTTVGTGGANSVTGQTTDPANPAGTGTLQANAFTVAPVIATSTPLRRAHLPAAIGAGLIWAWSADAPLVVPASGSVVLWTPVIAGAAAISSYVRWTE